MSSKIEIKRVCEHCGQIFTARTTITRYCSHICNSRAYKLQQKKGKIQQSNQATKNTILKAGLDTNLSPIVPLKETVNIKELAAILGVSERTLFRLIRDKEFPKIKLGRRLVFKKNLVIDFITCKYGAI